MRSRFMVRSKGLSRPGRTIVSLIGVPGVAAHLLDRLVEIEAVDQLTVDVGDVIAGLDPCAPCGRVLGRSDDLHRTVLDRNGEAKAAVIPVGRGLELVEVGRFDVARMRIQRGEHAVDCALDQRLVVDLVDIIRLDALIDAHELLELLVIRGVGGSEGAGRHGNQGERSDERERRKQFADHFHTVRVLCRRPLAFSRLCAPLTGFEMNLR